ncbi:MAG: ATP cone domain-containing protein, partial [Planctomycetota bacterium]
GGLVIRRRRECLDCNKRYTTYERVERTARLMVIKKDGTRVAFDPQNVRRGIQSACGKRPVSEDVKERIVREVEDEVHREYDREVKSNEIGRRVAARLRDVDEVSYLRFAVEYYNLATLDDLALELSDLQSRTRNLPNQRELFR